ncbi:hypothetical protein SLEP1_g52165 [Rubroshorea leprosula]|uniref:WAT1-related protein n=1 Tax=Rubroshorea leprosula TaxID=152421 RepID=A0AAV5M5E6_9ROSI|nr:hypothetical protein SLEP1_g52165 [Rubroshorea leprosula]
MFSSNYLLFFEIIRGNQDGRIWWVMDWTEESKTILGNVYRHAIAFLVIAPFAFFLKRNVRPQSTLPIFLRIMALGILEPVLDQNLYNVGITHTSATMRATFANMLPVITFILMIIFRLEKVNVKKFHSVATSFTLKKYPVALSLAALVCLMGIVEGAVVSLIFERDMIVWRVGFNYRLLVVAYSGVICSGLAYYVQRVVIKERGPVFTTSFSPLSMIITVALGAIVLKELVHLGSILGPIFIMSELYIVVWGKSKESQSTLEQTNQEVPAVTATSVSSSEEDEIKELPVDHGGIVNDSEGEIQELPVD